MTHAAVDAAAVDDERDPFDLLAPINRAPPPATSASGAAKTVTARSSAPPPPPPTTTYNLATERDETTQTTDEGVASSQMDELIARVRALEALAREGFAAHTRAVKTLAERVEALTGRLETLERIATITRGDDSGGDEDVENERIDDDVDDVRRASSYEDVRGVERERDEYARTRTYARDYDARDYDARDYDERTHAPPPPPPPPPGHGRHHHPPPPHHRSSPPPRGPPPPHRGPPPPHHGGPPPARYAPPSYGGPPPPMTPEPGLSYGAPPASPQSASVPLEHMIADFASMGFTRQQVTDTVGAMAARGENIEVNEVLDRLMRGVA